MCKECEKIMLETRSWYGDLKRVLKERGDNEQLILNTLGVDIPKE